MSAGGEPELRRLKALLFGAEARRLAEAESRLDAIEARTEARTEAPASAEALAPLVAAALPAAPSRAALARLLPSLAWRAAAGAPRALAAAIDRRLDALAPFSGKTADRRGLRWLAIGLLAAVALGLALRGPVERARKSAEIEAALRDTRAADARLAAYPLAVSIDWSARTVDLRGLVPSRDALRALVEALTPAALPLALETHVETVASAEALQAGEARLEARLAAQAAELKTLAERLAKATAADQAARAAQSLEAAAGEARALNASLARTRAKVGALERAINASLGADLAAVLPQLERDAASVAAGLDEAIASAARTEAGLRAQAEAARQRAQAPRP